jgi:hypothetical protein
MADTKFDAATLASCTILARIAWPYENADNQAKWAHKIARDPDIGRNTYHKAIRNSDPNKVGIGLRLHVELAADNLRDRGITWITDA